MNLKFKIMQQVSGNYLCENLPDNWEELAEEEQNEFLETNAWEPVEDLSADELFSLIEDSVPSTQAIVELALKELKKIYIEQAINGTFPSDLNELDPVGELGLRE